MNEYLETSQQRYLTNVGIELFWKLNKEELSKAGFKIPTIEPLKE